jgi:hypothetical protein
MVGVCVIPFSLFPVVDNLASYLNSGTMAHSSAVTGHPWASHLDFDIVCKYRVSKVREVTDGRDGDILTSVYTSSRRSV